MAGSKRIDLICILAMALSVVMVVMCMGMAAAGASGAGRTMGYENRLFDPSRVHTIDIVMDNWDEFIKTCENEEYAACRAVINGEVYNNVAIRAKGNTSLSSVSQMDSDRYSFKIEFDHYDSALSYHGLDKLSLNNLIQDNTFMKDYLVYSMMRAFGANAPLASFAWIRVNGEDWGLYLAVEGVEDAFLYRNYGANAGDLYKPDSMNMGGGRGNGRGFDMDIFQNDTNAASKNAPETGNMPTGMQPPSGGFDFSNMQPPSENGFDFEKGGQKGFSFGGMGASGVKLQYIDDDPESYKNIFESAKTTVTDADKTRLISALKKLSGGDASAVDVESVIRYFVVHNFVVNDDSYTGSMIHNYYLYEKDGKLSMLPWDYNLAFGTFQGGNASSAVNRDIDSPVTGGMDDRPMIKWIFENEEYTRLYHEYFREFLSRVDALSIIEEAEGLIAQYVQRDPTRFCTYEEFEKGVQALKQFVTLRAESVSNQLDGVKEAVDVSGLTLSDMGTMGGGRGEKTRTESMPVGNTAQEEMTQLPPDEGNRFLEKSNVSENRPSEAAPTRTQRTFEKNDVQPENGASAQTLLWISVVVLLASILIACWVKH